MSYGGPNEREVRRMFLEGELSLIESMASGAASRLAFDDVIAEVGARRTALEALPEQVTRARARGYAWGGNLEGEVARLRSAAGGAVETARQQSQRGAQALRGRVDALQREARRLHGGPVLKNERAIEVLANEARALDAALDAAKRAARESVGTFLAGADAAAEQVRSIHGVLDQFEAASFALQPEENPLWAVKATWEDAPGGEKPGMLFLTAHRLRFEAQEEVVLERSMLFFASRTEVRRQLALDVLIGQVVASEDTERGVLLKDQLLVVTVRAATGAQRLTFELDEGNAKQVDGLIEQVRSGDLERARYRGPMPEGSKVGVPVRWVERCDNCGAGMQPPVRGQTFTTCEYCGRKFDVVLGEG